MTNDEKRGHNLRKLQERLPADVRTDAANRHVDALETMPIPSVKEGLLNRNPYRIMYTSFLAGWDAAMSLDHEELLEEHFDLHGKLMDIAQKKLQSDGEFLDVNETT